MKSVWVVLLALATGIVDAQTEPPHWLEGYRQEAKLFDGQGYRVSRYRSPTPEQSDDASLVTTEELSIWLKTDHPPRLLDVMPVQTFAGEFVLSEPRLNIPGSVWLPNVGYGEISPDVERYFRQGLEQLTGGNRDVPVVIYCRADCWMSWNAVKRARHWAYTRLYWYRDGMSGWREAGLAQQESIPVPLTPDR